MIFAEDIEMLVTELTEKQTGLSIEEKLQMANVLKKIADEEYEKFAERIRNGERNKRVPLEAMEYSRMAIELMRAAETERNLLKDIIRSMKKEAIKRRKEEKHVD